MNNALSDIHEIINSVLKSIKQLVLGENEKLIPEKLNGDGSEWHGSLNEEGTLFFVLVLNETGVTFHNDTTDETPNYSIQQRIENCKEFEKVLETLFTKRSRIMYKGNKTTVEFFDQVGKTIYFYSFYTGIGFSLFPKERLFG